MPYKENYPVSRRAGQTTPAADVNKAAQSKPHKEKLEIWNYSRDSAHQDEDSLEASHHLDLLKHKK